MRPLRLGVDARFRGTLAADLKEGEARLNAYLEDHAFLVEALLRLYEATLEVRWFDAARETADSMIERLADDERGGFYDLKRPRGADCPPQGRRRPSDPSGNSSAAYGLLRLSALTGERAYEERAVGTMRLFAPAAARHPDAFGHLLQAIDFHLSPVREIALVAPANGAAGSARSPSSPGSFAPPTGRTWYSPVARRPQIAPSSSASGPQSRASPQPTSASSSPARHP